MKFTKKRTRQLSTHSRSPALAAEPASLRVRALRLLARREYSRLELKGRLSSEDTDAGDIDSLLDDFESKGWLSERRFVDAVVQTRRSRFGSVKILHELRAKGASEEGLARARQALADDEFSAARSVWQKKFGAKPASLSERAKQARFLGGRGFSAEVVRKVLGDSDD
jgi:regulatory protein